MTSNKIGLMVTTTMISKTDISKDNYQSGDYIGYEVQIPNSLPQSMVINGTLLQLKTAFHVTVLGVRHLIERAREEGVSLTQEQVEQAFEQTLERYPLEFEGFRQEFRYAEKDDKASLVILCSIKNLKDFFAELSTTLHVQIPVQPTHITLYTKQLDEGIGLSTPDMMSMTKDVSGDVPTEIRDKFKFFK